MERLWAPWRMAYIETSAPPGCIFCTKPAEADEQHAATEIVRFLDPLERKLRFRRQAPLRRGDKR